MSWFRYRYSVENRGDKNPWKRVLGSLRDAQAPPPVKLPVWQHWMKKNADLIAKRYDRLHPLQTAAEHGKGVNERCRIA